ncbi:MAG: hypothetical protein B7Y15_07755 [Bacteroidetes bacterium 24-39-8]|nr:MAG: hypothetical protein B7Y69_09475 [Sphingobacteriia bacterium 35-40-8]OYZ50932.1 MAG: hypothetical protein B7Y15_07755 [Bacteroidetes bacterium 24-39-8]OZA67640.1 MAG: hypothetical protein B7X72_03395 [Sphingobacteriia bacterium 39-39-8]HQR91933.1 glycosyltransferase family 39 protein [Sediminibacterium sp.]HQS55173.1 glycosyltransferase family 39 protein [Sediminibacterium sp.]
MHKNFPNLGRQLVLMILGIALLKLVVASLLELGNDEVYYWTYAIAPDWNHFDHPPMVGWMIQLTTFNLHWVSEISLRLGPILGSILSSFLVYKTMEILSTQKAAFYAALLYQFSLYTGVIAGLFVLPDAPQMPFWTGALYLMSKLLFQKGAADKLINWVLLGALIGLAILCKVHGLYLWAGFGLSILLLKPKWLLKWQMYISIVISLLCIIPILYWNIQYDFITYRFHSERVTHTSLHWDSFLQELGGEIAYQNPIVFILLLVSLLAYFKRSIRFEKKEIAIWLFCMSLPMIFLFWGIALFNPTLPHWTGPAYIPLYFFAGIYMANNGQLVKRKLLISSAVMLLLVFTLGVSVIRLSPINFGSQEKANYGEYCPTLDLTGWANFSKDFSQLVQADQLSGKMKPNSPILVSKWFPGGHLEFYTARKYGMNLIGVGALTDLHKFAWLNHQRPVLKLGDDAYCIVPSNLPFDVVAAYANYFTSIEQPIVINQVRNKGIVRYFSIYRLKQCKLLPADPLPIFNN